MHAWRVDPSAGALLSVLLRAPVELRSDVPTARIVRRGSELAIELGEAFSLQLADGAELCLLLLHEAGHAVLGHLRHLATRSPRRRLAEGVACDLCVNGILLRRGHVGETLLARSYVEPLDPARGDVPMLSVLLAPPHLLLRAMHRFLRRPELRQLASLSEARRVKGYEESLERILQAGGLDAERARAAARLHRGAWLLDRDPCVATLTEGILALMGGDEDASPQLLGNHEGEGEALDEVAENAGDALATQPGRGGPTRRDRIHVPRRPTLKQRAFQQAIEAALDDGDRTKRTWTRSVIPSRCGRRALALQQLGLEPMFWPTRRTRPRRRVQAYVDLSYSMRPPVVGALYSLLAALGPRLAQPLWGWSTEVHPLSLSEVLAGVRISTGGTSADAALEHMLTRARSGQASRRVLCITDGMVRLDRTLARAVREELELVLLLTRSSGAGGLRRCARSTFVLPLDA
jgi:hypothetical protein